MAVFQSFMASSIPICMSRNSIDCNWNRTSPIDVRVSITQNFAYAEKLFDKTICPTDACTIKEQRVERVAGYFKRDLYYTRETDYTNKSLGFLRVYSYVIIYVIIILCAEKKKKK